jgi:hypothetical protein
MSMGEEGIKTFGTVDILEKRHGNTRNRLVFFKIQSCDLLQLFTMRIFHTLGRFAIYKS